MVRKIDRDANRFKQIVRGKIKSDLRKYITHGEMIGKTGGEYVSIPLPQIELPDIGGGWTIDPALTLARRAEQALLDLRDDDEAWARVQRQIAEELTELQRALSALGHQADCGVLPAQQSGVALRSGLGHEQFADQSAPGSGLYQVRAFHKEALRAAPDDLPVQLDRSDYPRRSFGSRNSKICGSTTIISARYPSH